MCGIAGHVNLEGVTVDHDQIERMVVALKHRGPDAQTVHLDGPVGLGHARLSIIDLEGGRQPLFNEDQSVTVICNGEIYNYRELRQGLIQRGHRFRTGSDCEVIAHLWEESGSRLVDQLRGMFALVLYDRKQRIVFGARDRFGQKPLYYHHDGRTFSFASEIKGLLVAPEVARGLDPLALDQFLFYQFVPQPRTLFAGVKKLPAGACFELQLPSDTNDPTTLVERKNVDVLPISPEVGTGTVTKRRIRGSHLVIWRYWQPRFAPDEQTSDSEHLQRVEAALTNAVESHMVADVPVGVFLSGGIDSSLITALAAKFNPQPLETFSISFPGSAHDEGAFANSVAKSLGTVHRDFPFAPGDMREMLARAAILFDQPVADPAVLPLMSLSQGAANYVKVVLTGDGGDELFAGYRKYQRMTKIPGRSAWLSQLTTSVLPMQKLAACRADKLRVRKLLTRLAMSLAPCCRSEYHRQGWEGWERCELYRPELSEEIDGRFASLREPADPTQPSLSPLNYALRLDQGTVLADRLLLKGDCATMAYGLEARAPLLDHQLADVAGTLPTSLKVTSSRTKVALREIASQLLPDEIVSRRKKGFSLPLADWFRGDLQQWIAACLVHESISLPRFFQRAAVETLLKEHASGKDHSSRIYTLLMFELWCRTYLI